MKVKLVLFFFLSLNMSLAQITAIDQTFGTAGKVLTDVGISSYGIQASAIDATGKIVVAGFAYPSTSSGVQVLTLVRYNLDGSLDASFGNGGVVRGIPQEGFNESPVSKMAMIILNDGKIVVAHGNRYGSYQNAIINKFNSNGSVDTSFGSNGSVTSIAGFQFASAIAITSDDKLIVGGYNSNNFNSCILTRLNTNGIVDTSFGTNGFTTINTFDNQNPYAYGVKVMNEGKILIAISKTSQGYPRWLFAQLNENGTADANFGINGLTQTTFNNSTNILDFAVDQDNKIIACGGTSSAIAMAKFTSAGLLDTTFGTDGKVTFVYPNYSFSSCERLILLNDGKIITSGTTEVNPDPNIYESKYNLIRFNADGSLDSTFGVNGIILDDFDTNNVTNFSTRSLQLYGNKLYLAGGNYSPYSVYGIARYNIDSNLSAADFTEDVSTFSASPNPFTTTLNIAFVLPKNQNLSLDLFDSNGRKIQNLIQDKIFPSGNSTTEIQMPESLSKGVYFIKVFNGSTNTTLKIIK